MMLDDNFSELLPEEDDKPGKHLTQALCDIYDTRSPDAQSLASIRSRLLARSAETSSIAPRQEQILCIPNEARRSYERQIYPHSIYSTFQQAQPWQRLSILAATLFIAVTVGSLILLLTLARANTMISGSQPSSGWARAASLQGNNGQDFTQQTVHLAAITIGNKTIIPRIWAILVTCTGPGQITLHINVPTQLDTPKCDAKPKLQVLQYHSQTSIHALQISTKGVVAWNVQVFACVDEQHCLNNTAFI